MARYTGEMARECTGCDEPMQFALGIDTEKEILRGQHFGPGGPQTVTISDWSAQLVTEAQVVLSVSFACPMCSKVQESTMTCQRVLAPGEDTIIG